MLRKAGLSGAKVEAMRDLAQKTLDGVVPSHDEAVKMSDEELVKRLVSVRGIGAWTVEMFLIFRLGRPDVLPIHNLGVKKGWSVAYGKKHMPKPKELLKFGEHGARTARSPVGTCGGRLNAQATKSPTTIRPRPVRPRNGVDHEKPSENIWFRPCWNFADGGAVATRPSSRTARLYPRKLVQPVDATCRGSISGVLCTETITRFSFSMRLLTVNCDAAVSPTINTTQSAAGAVKLAKL